jgi:Uncharacterised nucleotidyltransferase
MDCERPIRQTSIVDRQSEVRIAVLTDAVQVRELTRVLCALEEAGVVPVVFKGAALAQTHYLESWRRPREDADLLIAPESCPRVFSLLKALGYERPAFISGDLVTYQAPFVRVDALGIEHALDVHWRIANPQAVSRVLTHDELVARSVTISVHGQPMRVPSAVDGLLLACVHRAAHHADSENVIWLSDIHLIAKGLDASEWRTFAERATSRSVRALCARGLRLAGEHFQTRLPPDVMTDLDAGGREASAVFLRKDLRPVDRLAADLRALSPRAAARLVREHLFPPAEYVRAVYGVRSRALLPVYYAARAWRGMFKWLRAA